MSNKRNWNVFNDDEETRLMMAGSFSVTLRVASSMALARLEAEDAGLNDLESAMLVAESVRREMLEWDEHLAECVCRLKSAKDAGRFVDSFLEELAKDVAHAALRLSRESR